MGQRDTEHRPRRRRLPETLEVRLPPLFRCPISLEVMRSPVSLCTGVTYDRSSIQRWLDSGHRTCPATRLPLPSTLLVPNLALRGLILSSAAAAAAADDDDDDDDGGDDGEYDGRGGRSEPSAAEIASRIAAAAEEGGDPEAAVRVLAPMLGSDRVGKGDDKESAIAALVADLDRSVPALLEVVRKGREIGPRIDAVRVLEAILASPARVCGEESKAAIAEREELFPELVRMMGDGEAAEAAIGCMAAAAAAGKRRAARARMVGAGAVAALARAIAAAEVSAAAAEKGMALVGAAAWCAEGRVAIAGDAAAVVGALMGRITRVGAVGREAAVAALWAVCCGGGSSGGGGGDKRAREAMLAVPGGLGKLLEVMQRECSPAAARMARDLLRIYTSGAVKNGGLAGFDSKTIHVMPY